MLRVGLLWVAVLVINSFSLQLLSLNDLWVTKHLAGHHLFPTHDSSLYPHFLAIPAQGSSRIHMTHESVHQISRNRLIHSVCSYRYVNTTYFVTNEESGLGMTELALNISLEELQSKANFMTFRLMKPSYFCYEPSQKTFHAVWQRPITPLKHFEIALKPISEMISMDQKLGMSGYYPDCWQVFNLNGTIVALAIWRKGFGVRYRVQNGHSLEEVAFGMKESDMNPIALSVLPKKQKDPAMWWLIWSGDSFTWRNRQIQKSQVIPKQWTYVDNNIVAQMKYYDIPSISICIRNSTAIIYEAAYGYSDLRKETQATPQNEYRIASISKTLTAMGIAKLLARKQLFLESKVFGEEGILQQYSVHSSLKEITIRHLLEHATGGWSHFQRHEFNRNESDHITFVKRLVTGYVIQKRQGEVFTYSNIGYLFLGRVIEQITGVNYEQFVQREVLQPIGIEAKIGNQFPGQNEVMYYSQDNASPYNHWNPKLLDSATGWVFSAGELAKVFGSLESGRGTDYSIVATRSLATRTYGRGIQIGEDGSLFHTGSLAGSEAFAVTRGVQVVILTNLRGRQHNVHTGWMQAFSRKLLDELNK